MRNVLGFGVAGLALSSLCGVFIGLGTFTFSYADGASYLSNDPMACVNCHIMREQYDGWQKAPHHANATCNDCHIPHEFVRKYVAKGQHGWRHSKAFTLNDFHEPIQITPEDRQIVVANCLRCHDAFVHDVAFAVSGMGTSTEPIDCIRCHARVGHGPVN